MTELEMNDWRVGILESGKWENGKQMTELEMNKRNEFRIWFYNFIKENDIPYKSWDIEYCDKVYFMDTYTVEDCILSAPAYVQDECKELMIEIYDRTRSNNSINDYFHQLAYALVKEIVNKSVINQL